MFNILTFLFYLQLLLIDGTRFDVEYEAIDGDTLIARSNEGIKFKIRMFAIDAPEKEQNCLDENNNIFPCGQEAKEHLKMIIEDNKDNILCVEGFNKDKYGRIIATCFTDKDNINMKMVEDGYAIAYGHSIYKNQQKSSCEAKRNIWRGKMAVPQDWRKNKYSPYKNLSCDSKNKK